MGTTGGDPAAVAAAAERAGVYAVVAPQMGKQVAAFQAMVELMAQQFPGVFAGYTLRVVESHQRSKIDASGTARAVAASFRRMGVDFDEVGLFCLGCGVCFFLGGVFVQTHNENPQTKPTKTNKKLK